MLVTFAGFDQIRDVAGAAKPERGGDETEAMPSLIPAEPGAGHTERFATSVIGKFRGLGVAAPYIG
jgi:hypothetical protein